MRTAFVTTLCDLAARDDRIMLLTADLGFMVLEPFARAYPTRFVNVGVAEANMIGLATGLAAQGFLPFCYSIATFASMRGYEQLRNGPVLHGLPVRLVGIGGGFAYGSAGITHHALEDIGLARLQPGLAVIAPADDLQAGTALRETYTLDGPVYYRIGKDRVTIPGLDGRFRLRRLETIEPSLGAVADGPTGDGAGSAAVASTTADVDQAAGPSRRDLVDVLFVTYGGMTASVARVAEQLRAAGTTTRVAVLASIHPPPLEDLRAYVTAARLVVTVEDHYVSGGAGSLVAEVIADEGLGTPLLRQGVRRPAEGRSGSEAYLREQAGLSEVQLLEAARAALQRTPACERS